MTGLCKTKEREPAFFQLSLFCLRDHLSLLNLWGLPPGITQRIVRNHRLIRGSSFAIESHVKMIEMMVLLNLVLMSLQVLRDRFAPSTNEFVNQKGRNEPEVIDSPLSLHLLIKPHDGVHRTANALLCGFGCFITG